MVSLTEATAGTPNEACCSLLTFTERLQLVVFFRLAFWDAVELNVY